MDGDRRWRRMWSLGWMARKQQPKAARRRKPYSLLAGWMGIGGGGQGQNSRTIERVKMAEGMAHQMGRAVLAPRAESRAHVRSSEMSGHVVLV
uniref:Uncharacterized protein n=1 Tax=Oryza sativa subsp. japonica TaxID=39947 RepID=Q10JG4_ORYSJ|nr:hypothetical protein LOC_Os03g30744 [Oryza sativa Japonica Group]